MSKTIDPIKFISDKKDEIFTKDACKHTEGAVATIGADAEDKVLMNDWVKKSIPTWPVSIMTPKALVEQMTTIQNMSSVLAGNAEIPYKIMCDLLGNLGLDVFKRVETLIPGYTTVGDKIVAVVDVGKFKTEVVKLLSVIDKSKLKSSVISNNSEQDFFYIVNEMFKVEESYSLLAVLGVRLLISKEERIELDKKLIDVTVLKNRSGQLSQGVVRLGGFITLAACNSIPDIKKYTKNVVNPLLGDEVSDRLLTQKPAETVAQYKERKEIHDRGFEQYRKIIGEMKNYQKDFAAIPAASKEKIVKATKDLIC